MELSYIKKIIKLLENSSIDEIEIEEEGKKLRVARSKAVVQTVAMAPPSAPVAAPAPAAASSAAEAARPKSDKSYHEVRSPIVGTFYRAPSPDADVYVQEGQSVRSGQVLCIVEAMKLMNEIESDADGKIVKILVENGKPEDYHQVLFLIDKG